VRGSHAENVANAQSRYDGSGVTMGGMPGTTAPEREATEQVESSSVADPDRPWITVVWNDPINLMSYVTHVFMSVFGYPKPKAEKLMLDVHHRGRAVVSTGSRERMELDVHTLHGYGLWATLEQQK
jgi:ATP-dependent Clp protease adaptor protein ClpS